jgi:hypothetical protein
MTSIGTPKQFRWVASLGSALASWNVRGWFPGPQDVRGRNCACKRRVTVSDPGGHFIHILNFSVFSMLVEWYTKLYAVKRRQGTKARRRFHNYTGEYHRPYPTRPSPHLHPYTGLRRTHQFSSPRQRAFIVTMERPAASFEFETESSSIFRAADLKIYRQFFGGSQCSWVQGPFPGQIWKAKLENYLFLVFSLSTYGLGDVQLITYREILDEGWDDLVHLHLTDILSHTVVLSVAKGKH